MLQCSNFKQRLSSFQATENDLPEELFKKKQKSINTVQHELGRRENLNTTASLDVMCTIPADLLRVSSVMPWVSSCGAALSQEMFQDEVSTGFDHKTQVSYINNVKQHVLLFKQAASNMCLADIFHGSGTEEETIIPYDTISCYWVQNPVHVEICSSKT